MRSACDSMGLCQSYNYYFWEPADSMRQPKKSESFYFLFARFPSHLPLIHFSPALYSPGPPRWPPYCHWRLTAGGARIAKHMPVDDRTGYQLLQRGGCNGFEAGSYPASVQSIERMDPAGSSRNSVPVRTQTAPVCVASRPAVALRQFAS